MSEIIPCTQRLWLLFADEHDWSCSQVVGYRVNEHLLYDPVVILPNGAAGVVRISPTTFSRVVREVKLATETEKFLRELEERRAA